jgi:hypothetical protein
MIKLLVFMLVLYSAPSWADGTDSKDTQEKYTLVQHLGMTADEARYNESRHLRFEKLSSVLTDDSDTLAANIAHNLSQR